MIRRTSVSAWGLFFMCASMAIAQDESYRFTFEPTDGRMTFEVPNGLPLVRAVRLQSTLDLFAGTRPDNLEGHFDVFRPGELFKLELAAEGFSVLDFGPVVTTDTPGSVLYGSLCVDVVPITGGLNDAVLEDVSTGAEFTLDTCRAPNSVKDPIDDPMSPTVPEPKTLLSSVTRVNGLVETPLSILGPVSAGMSPFHDLPSVTIISHHGFSSDSQLISLPASDVSSDSVFQISTNGITTFHVAVESGAGPFDWMTPEFTGLPTRFFPNEAARLVVGIDEEVPGGPSYDIWTTVAGRGTFRFGSAPDGHQVVLVADRPVLIPEAAALPWAMAGLVVVTILRCRPDRIE